MLDEEKINSIDIDPYIAIFLDGDYKSIDLVPIKNNIIEFCEKNKINIILESSPRLLAFWNRPKLVWKILHDKNREDFNINDDEIDEFINWCIKKDFDLTFIETMPMGDIGNETRLDQYWPLSMLRANLRRRWTLTETDFRTGGPARYWRIEETGGRIGFITPLTHNFCESCNRVRMTCTGQLFMCLGQEEDADLRSALREGSDNDHLLRKRIMQAVDRKPKGHDFDYSRKKISGQMSRFMSHTGG